MKAITPAKLRPPDHSTAASGTLPTEHTKLSTAMTGPMSAPQSVWTAAGASSRKRPLKKSSPSSAMKPGQQEAREDLLPQHLPVAAEVVRHVGPGVGRGQPRAPGQARARRVVLVAGVGAERVLARDLLVAARDEDPQQRPHEGDHHDAAEVLGEGELPADEHPQHEAQLPDEVRRGELEGQRRAGRGALLEQALGDRDRRVGARRGRGAQARGAGHGTEAVAGQRALDALARHPRLDDGGDREAQDERPPDLPGHEHRVPQAVADLGDHVGHAALSPGA